MARVRTRLPRIFVGHPFANRFPSKRFRGIFDELPFFVIYGNTDLRTEHLLRIMKTEIAKADFSIFDISDWNANVALELGLAEGLKRSPGKPYYIILNTNRSRDVPSDIKGIQRLEYTSYDYKAAAGLGDQLIKYILAKEYLVKQIWKAIPDSDKGRKKRRMVLRILAHFRNNEQLTLDNIRAIMRGTRLRQLDRDDVLEILRSKKIIQKIRNSSAYKRTRNLYN